MKSTKTKSLVSLVALLLTFVQAQLAAAVEVQVYSNETRRENGNTIILDNDDTGGNIILQFGQTLGKQLYWDATNNAFVFNDNVIMGGNLNVNGVITAGTGNVLITRTDGTIEGNNIANDSIKDNSIDFGMGTNQVGADDITTTDNFNYSNSTNVQGVLEDLDQAIDDVTNGNMNMGGTLANTFVLNTDNDPNAPVTLQFGGTMLGSLTHDGTLFIFNDDLRVDGNLTVNGDTNHNGNVNVVGSSTISQNLNVNGTTTTNGVTVNGTSNLNGNVNVSGSTTVNQNLNVNGTTTLANTTINGTTNQNGNMQIHGNLNVNGSITGATIDGGNNTITNVNWNSMSTRTKAIAITMNDLTVDADGSNNQADVYNDVETGTNPHQYYILRTRQNSLQDLDLKIKVKLPEDFVNFTGSTNDVQFFYKNTGTSVAQSAIDFRVQDSTGANAFTPATGLYNTNWTNYQTEITGGTFTAGSYMYITIKGYASYAAGYRSPYVGELVISYTGR